MYPIEVDEVAKKNNIDNSVFTYFVRNEWIRDESAKIYIPDERFEALPAECKRILNYSYTDEQFHEALPNIESVNFLEEAEDKDLALCLKLKSIATDNINLYSTSIYPEDNDIVNAGLLTISYSTNRLVFSNPDWFNKLSSIDKIINLAIRKFKIKLFDEGAIGATSVKIDYNTILYNINEDDKGLFDRTLVTVVISGDIIKRKE